MKALQVIEPRLSRLAVVIAGGVPIIHGDIGLERLVPLPIMGEDMRRLASLVLAMANAPNGVAAFAGAKSFLRQLVATC